MVKDTTISFISKAIDIHGDCYDYSLVEYVNNATKVVIICPIHGKFEQRPNDHLKGHKCNKCSITSRSKSLHVFLDESLKRHGELYDYSNVIYKQSHTKIKIICRTHGEFLQTPESHLRSEIACPKCSVSGGFKQNKPGILYYLSIDNGTAYKIGITNNSVERRFATSDLDKIKVLKIWEYPIGEDAYNTEQRILKEYKQYKYIGSPLLTSGNTELFSIDVLDLDVIS